MRKYSILIPTYNRANMIEKCINSVLSQTFDDYEIIVLDDKSTDDTIKVLEKYKNKIKLIKHETNRGISISRNDLIKEVNTPYFTFLDSDDFFKSDMLEICDQYCDGKTELLSFCYSEVDSNLNFIRDVIKTKSNVDTGENIITRWINDRCSFDTPVCYIYKTDFFKLNKFKYEEGRNHEDFALTPVIICKAKKMISIEDTLYNVLLSDKSIVRTKKNAKKNVYDKLYHYDNLIRYFNASDIKDETKRTLFSFLSNSLINDINRLNKSDKKEYIRELKNRNITENLLVNNVKRKIKKIIIKLKYKI